MQYLTYIKEGSVTKPISFVYFGSYNNAAHSKFTLCRFPCFPDICRVILT